MQDRLALLVVCHLGDEGAVDLQRVDGEALQVGHGGVAGAEVVDRDAHAEGLDRGEALAAAWASRISAVSVISIVSEPGVEARSLERVLGRRR